MGLRTRWRPGDAFLVRHKDAAVLVVEKKAGMLTHAGPEQDEASLLSSLRDFLGDKDRRALKAVHRLDRVVSGLLVLARTEKAFLSLEQQFAERRVERLYVAGVEGTPATDRARLESWLDVERLMVRIVRPDHPGARLAVTEYAVVERFPRARAALLEVRLETGLRNQIRVHLAAEGLPLLGERKYHPARPKPQGSVRVFLHAGVLGFVHPYSGAPLRFEAPLPPELRRWAAALRAGPAPTCPPPARPRRR